MSPDELRDLKSAISGRDYQGSDKFRLMEVIQREIRATAICLFQDAGVDDHGVRWYLIGTKNDSRFVALRHQSAGALHMLAAGRSVPFGAITSAVAAQQDCRGKLNRARREVAKYCPNLAQQLAFTVDGRGRCVRRTSGARILTAPVSAPFQFAPYQVAGDTVDAC